MADKPQNVATSSFSFGENLLISVQQSKPYEDSKTFVDMPLISDGEAVKLNFEEMVKRTAAQNLTVSKEVLKKFLTENFRAAGSDLVPWNPPDWRPEPEGFLPAVQEEAMRIWALQVHALWHLLGKRISPEVCRHPSRHTILSLPHPMMVPGDRFREAYYWDSYWVVRGLLVSGMLDTAGKVVENLMALLDTHGYVPNGARSYYLNRSQPPLLSQMVMALWEASKDRRWLKQALPLLLREHSFFTEPPKAVWIVDEKGCSHCLSRYYASWEKPRPESWWEDAALAEGLPPEEAAALYRNLASAAESGWDFSSRWFSHEGEVDGRGGLTTTRTTSVVPADLNALLYQMERNIAHAARKLEAIDVASKFEASAARRLRAMDALLWDPEGCQWRDYILQGICSDSSRVANAEDVAGADCPLGLWRGMRSTAVCASNFVGLWCGCVEPGSPRALSAVEALRASGLVLPGGVSTTLRQTGEQWDFPNAWPPLQHMIIEGLNTAGGDPGATFAKQLARRWVLASRSAFDKTGHMHEKLDATAVGAVGSGGEYNPQVGFGWSNGVVLSLLETFGWPIV
ncbi:hypothetical protein CYMTET_54640 [Cymbomonas tetramitiformis]|uniref:Trehalase n=1 Tax=Cymbomonas tetramitiformis TaxID=36881 RepID=A0AAE0BEI1_9CHLO|nr:hypothetical protein CYMTET_54640 [Cymbomonas tetramitiformis]